MNTVDPLLKAGEVAKMLNISVTSIYRRMADGTIPRPIKLGGLSRWAQSDILRALDDARDKAGSARQ